MDQKRLQSSLQMCRVATVKILRVSKIAHARSWSPTANTY
jgi:hypothetical protein